jgi:hypothetical protein
MFQVDPPHIPDAMNHVGSYQTTFVVPDDWCASRRIWIVFEGVSSAFYCWINGTLVGYSQDSRLPAEFDITLAVQQAARDHPHRKHVLSVRVFRFCDGSYLEDQVLALSLLSSLGLPHPPPHHARHVLPCPPGPASAYAAPLLPCHGRTSGG